MAVIDDAMLARGRNDLTEHRHGLAIGGEDFAHLLDRVRLHDRDHADAAIEGAQHFRFGDVAGAGEPLEERQDRHAIELQLYKNLEAQRSAIAGE